MPGIIPPGSFNLESRDDQFDDNDDDNEEGNTDKGKGFVVEAVEKPPGFSGVVSRTTAQVFELGA